MSQHSAESPCNPMCNECCRLLVNKRIDDHVAKPLRDRIARLESDLARTQAEAAALRLALDGQALAALDEKKE